MEITENVPENVDFYNITYYPMEQKYAVGVWYKDKTVEVLDPWFDNMASAETYINNNLTFYEKN